MRVLNIILIPAVVGPIVVGVYRAPSLNAPPPLDALVGSWRCAGAFANGRPIASHIHFESILDGRWLRYQHDDDPPNGFHAVAEWGRDTLSGQFTAVMHDNFGSVRLFTSPAGWHDDQVVLESAPLIEKPRFLERFTYRLVAADTLTMSYEAARLPRAGAGDPVWQLGDSLTCTRN